MKYEYLCGHVSDFFTMPENVIAVVRLDHCVQGLTEFSQITECGKPVLAMRRIIAEPKRWTVEDQKAGRLPDVGGKVDTFIGECMIIGADLNLKHVAVQYHDGYMDILHISKIKPIETPQEKAQREEDEFVKLMIDLASESQLMSCGFKDGVISAYRKLKGGE